MKKIFLGLIIFLLCGCSKNTLTYTNLNCYKESNYDDHLVKTTIEFSYNNKINKGTLINEITINEEDKEYLDSFKETLCNEANDKIPNTSCTIDSEDNKVIVTYELDLDKMESNASLDINDDLKFNKEMNLDTLKEALLLDEYFGNSYTCKLT